MSNKANAKAQLREAKDIEMQLRKELRRLRRRTEAEATTMTTQTHKFARAFTAMKEAKHASDSKLAAVQAELSRVNLNVGVMERLHRAEVEQLHTEYAKQRKSMQKASERLIAEAAKSGHVAATAKLASSGLSAAATRRISMMAAGGGDDGEGGATMLVHESTAALPHETAPPPSDFTETATVTSTVDSTADAHPSSLQRSSGRSGGSRSSRRRGERHRPHRLSPNRPALLRARQRRELAQLASVYSPKSRPRLVHVNFNSTGSRVSPREQLTRTFASARRRLGVDIGRPSVYGRPEKDWAYG